MEGLYHQDCRAECLAWVRDKGYMSSPMALFSMKVWECRADGTMRQTCSQKPTCHDEGCESTSLKTEHNRLWPCVCVCVCEWEETDTRAGLNNCASHQEQAPMGARKSHGEHQEFIKWCKNTEQTQDVGTWAVEITVEPLKRKKQNHLQFSLNYILEKYWRHHRSVFVFPPSYYYLMTISMQLPVLSLLSCKDFAVAYLWTTPAFPQLLRLSLPKQDNFIVTPMSLSPGEVY